jgi:hypothetical protein
MQQGVKRGEVGCIRLLLGSSRVTRYRAELTSVAKFTVQSLSNHTFSFAAR